MDYPQDFPAAAFNPVAAEYVRGLMQCRNSLIVRQTLLLENPVWHQFSDKWAECKTGIADIDRRVDAVMTGTRIDGFTLKEAAWANGWKT